MVGGFFGIDNLSQLFAGQPGGGLSFRGGIPGGGGGRAVLADFNTDGYLDIAGGSIVSGTFWKTVSVTLGHGDLEFSPSPPFLGPWPVLTEDFNGDGRPNLVLAGFSGPDSFFTVLLNTSPYGCLDRLTLNYAAGTLGISFRSKA